MIKKILLLITLFLALNSWAQKDIFTVARSGTVKDLKEIMKLNPMAINSVNESGFTPLILACYKSNNDVAKLLADEVSNLDVTTDMGTALMAAVVKGNIDLGSYLLEKKANPNLTDANGITALMYAVQFKNFNLVKALLNHKADKTIVDKNGKTAFEYAVFSENQEIINILK